MITVFGNTPTIEDLRKVEPTTPPNAGSRWKPIPHGELADTIREEAATRGWRIKDERYALGNKGADLAGAILLEGVKDVEVPTGQTLAMGFLHSNARRRALQLTVGTEVAVCNNGMCSGQVLMRRVHDHSVDLIDEVEAAFNGYVDKARKVASIARALRERELSKDEASGILLAAGRAGIVGWATVGRVDAEYRNPTFSDHGKDNSWALLNAFTYAARPNINPVRQMDAYNDFRALLPMAGLN